MSIQYSNLSGDYTFSAWLQKLRTIRGLRKSRKEVEYSMVRNFLGCSSPPNRNVIEVVYFF